MKDLIIKVISGNANKEETQKVEIWKSISEKNKQQFEQEKLLWDFIGITNETDLECDVDNAWSKFEQTKDNPISVAKSNLIYKIAAVLIIIISIGSIGTFTFFSDTNKTVAKIIKKKNTSNKINETKVIELAEVDVTPQETKQQFISKKKINNINNETIVEYVLLDSSTVTLADNSALNFLDNNHKKSRVATLVGAGVFDIKSSNQLFVLETDYLIVHVDGTKFNISDPEEHYRFVELSVQEGNMEVFDKTNFGNSITLTAGSKYLFDIDKKSFIKLNSKTKKSFWKK
jgi:ferric-dicitrate binding protein FerR (iron transport regulator)